METKVCKSCKIEKELKQYPKAKKDIKYYYYPNCKECSFFDKQRVCNKYYKKNKDKILSNSRLKYHKNIDKEHLRGIKYREANIDRIKNYRNNLMRQKRINDPAFKIKSNVSRAIRHALNKNNSSKGGLSFLKFMEYSIKELKWHLEKQFDPWMNWQNWGIYSKNTWDDNEPSTWTWQIDHIIPQSKLLYSSMEDENFKKCWALDNLRPLSAKQNFLLGIKLLRDNKS